MNSARIVIVGAGLSGLYAACLLEQKGIKDYVILEARRDLGGRILSMPISGLNGSEPPQGINPINSFDLGPSWFWPDFQRQLDRLVLDLGLERYEQYEAGNMVIEQSSDRAPIATPGYVSSPTSMRLVGGMKALINALHQRLSQQRILTGQTVKSLSRVDQFVEVHCEDEAGQVSRWAAERVLLAVPPRLAKNSIEFHPPLPDHVSSRWKAAATWMAPHAKYFAIYEKPFWHEQGLSGQGRSRIGPMVEIHDASIPGGSAALFGFLGVPPLTRRSIPEDQLRALCLAQLVRMFGEQARLPAAEFFKDWALDPFVATDADLVGAAAHAAAPMATIEAGPWSGWFTGIASEWSPQFPGYVAGAVEAASRGIQNITTSLRRQRNNSAT
ncbi:FAD-dependent oxidoreductase [Pseudomonas aeruginosa]|uniref:flavin monoamine oxidase family protein n=1 Tax=Pseudomonas aeruginosa TaxID=287 RepID=UPI001596B244|nr:FAD-dependent oxidoreductase [Pseudomonas aeruginosa]MBH4114834.1 FAD-dependent oxidoreductase [Pseudomonas aeruginosa]HCF3941556.1 FAD-dependent oxidoreductase [Pseudomonas aeruginosa]HEK3507668.1 FAD-dependent oxidoreductase [Pseudomonas aeruginosa]